MSAAPDIIRRARYRIIKRRPYFAAALSALDIIEYPHLPAPMAVDEHWRLYVAPDRLAEICRDEAEVEGVLLHELYHLLRQHHARAQIIAAQPEPWNIAADAEVNHSLQSMGEKLPNAAIYPQTFDWPVGRLAEEYYTLAQQRQAAAAAAQGAEGGARSGRAGRPPGQIGGARTGADTAGASSGDRAEAEGGASAECDASPTSHRSAAAQPTSPGTPPQNTGPASDAPSQIGSASRPSGTGGGVSPNAGRVTGSRDPGAPSAPPVGGPGPGAARLDAHGSGAGCIPGHWELPPPDAGGPPGLMSADAAALRRAVAVEIRRYIQDQDRGRGLIAGGWDRWADEMLQPARVPWYRELAASIRGALRIRNGCTDYTYARRSRRQAGCEHRLPANIQRVPHVAIVLDTSGSVSDADIASMLAEIRGIIRAIGGNPVDIVQCDSAVQRRSTITSAHSIARNLAGGGGTDMGIGLAAAIQSHPRPNVIVVLTDGHTPWPDQPPRNATVIITTTDRTGPAWAKNIVIER